MIVSTLLLSGIRSRGTDHINSWCALKDNRNVRIKTICDVDEQFFAQRVKNRAQTKPEKQSVLNGICERYLMIRKLMLFLSVFPTTGMHLSAIWACQAGKHVYAEKPACHNLFEGRKMIEAAAKYNVRVQTGCQNRSIDSVMEAIKFLHERRHRRRVHGQRSVL